MLFEIVMEEDLSGDAAKIYSIALDGDEMTDFINLEI